MTRRDARIALLTLIFVTAQACEPGELTSSRGGAREGEGREVEGVTRGPGGRVDSAANVAGVGAAANGPDQNGAPGSNPVGGPDVAAGPGNTGVNGAGSGSGQGAGSGDEGAGGPGDPGQAGGPGHLAGPQEPAPPAANCDVGPAAAPVARLTRRE